MDPFSLKIKELKYPGEISGYLREREDDISEAQKIVDMIVSDIRKDGDRALLRFIREYDGYDADIKNIRVGKDEVLSAAGRVKRDLPDLAEALAVSRKNIENYHKSQYERGDRSWMIEEDSGRKTGQKVTPIERVGLYIPGGRYAYPSTLLMTAIPAIAAGVKEIAICSPPGGGGRLNDVLLYLCSILEIEEIYRMGGAQAIAAMALGTGAIRKVEKIAGPGNMFVTLAKKKVFGAVGIDSLAGPSDVTIIADSSARAELIASDMLAQSEHDPVSRSILLSKSRDVAARTAENISNMLHSLKSDAGYRNNLKVMVESIGNNCLIFYNEDIAVLIEAANIIAPEHLEIMVEDSDYILDGIKNAGAIFVGDYTPVAVGDYIGGTNHVIPTGGSARFSSPLGVGDFLKRSSICRYSRKALEAEKKHIVEIADFEKLYAHRDSVLKRFKN